MNRAVEFSLTTVIVIVLVATTTLAVLIFLSGGFRTTGQKFGLLAEDLDKASAGVDLGADEWSICRDGWVFSRSEAYEPEGNYETKQECIETHKEDLGDYRCERSTCECWCLG